MAAVSHWFEAVPEEKRFPSLEGNLRVSELRQRQVENPENETISRRDDAGVSQDTSRRSNEEIGHFQDSRRAGESDRFSSSLVAHVSQDTHHSSFLEYRPDSLRSIDTGAIPRPLVNTVVVGGGIAGLVTAYLLAKAGVKVAVVEQGFLGSGDSGYTTAFISRFLDNAAATKKTWPAGEDTIRLIETIVQEENIDCEFRRVDSLYFTRVSSDGLAKEFEVISSCDSTMRFLDGDDAKTVCGFDVQAAIHKKDEGQFHIRKFLLGLAEAIQKHGGVIFEKTSVTAIEDAGRLVRGKTGSIKTERVVIATGMPPRFFPEVSKLLTPYLTFVVGTEFNGSRPFGEYLFWDDEDPYHYFRWVNEKELILGGVDRAMRGPKPAENPHDVLEKFLSGISAEKSTRVHAWQGSIFATNDSLPYYGTHPAYGDRIFFATGFGGNGMTFGPLAGKVISDMIVGSDNKFKELFLFNR